VRVTEQDADAGPPAWLRSTPEETVPPDVLQRLLGTVDAEVGRREEGETTRERAAAIAASLERTNTGTFGLNPPRRPTVPHVVEQHPGTVVEPSPGA
jgi:hypothetical protein